MEQKIIDLEQKLGRLVTKHREAVAQRDEQEAAIARDPEYIPILEELAKAYEEQGGCCGKGNAEYLRDLIKEAKETRTYREEYIDYYYLSDTREAGM